MKRKGQITFVAGFLAGAIIFGGAAAYAAGVIAQPETVSAVIDGRTATLKGYVIEGHHYFRLSETSLALKASGKDFSAVWDDASNRVVIDTTRGYEGEQLPQTAPAPLTGGYGYAFSPLKTGDIVSVSPVATSKGSVGGDYKILRGPEDKPWKTADGTLWPNAALPAWQSEWDSYPRLTFPNQPPVRFTGETYGFPYDTLMVFNPYEVERMARTIYKYARQNPLLWKNHDPSTNIPNFTISVEITNDMGPHTFYPWRDWEIEKFVKSTGGGTVIRIYAYDSYNNGKFLDTEYFMK
ncbi:MAG: hypothetical protein LBK56_02595 [Gracilibacteraceae bacterium]|jgi:hypothetical protein|nr:hypothetical protein [Gracilibacteraceae bacterium]